MPVLSGRCIRLEPLRLDHVDALLRAATENRVTYGFTGVPATRSAMVDYVAAAIADRDGELAVPFAIRDLAAEDIDGGRLVGSTRFLDLGFWRPDAGVRQVGVTATSWSATEQSNGDSQTWTTTSTTVHGSVVSTVTVQTSTQHSGLAQVDGGAVHTGGSWPSPPESNAGHSRPSQDGDAADASAPDGSVAGQPGAERHVPPACADLPSVAEIGATWLSASAQRTAINTEAKLLLLGHAFDGWSAVRVCLKTDARNARSRAAIERLGARFEGIRRAHMLATDGMARDTAYYSVLRAEWPGVRAGLAARLTRQ
ncbi:GNAT family N-acetyltransferase [Frankia sp. AgB32]|nr:GNAT family N-acetyltransferase [Frankia sp. AgB32]MCK9895854.1 GNAT family N-acetyltransferase [Frankia sp. AgB32]